MSNYASFTVDRDAAIKASGTPRISQKGAYAGEFTRAEAVTSTRGTTGIDLSFKSVDGSTADYLTIWTHNAGGEELSGAALVSALLTCMRQKGCTPKRARIEKYNPQSGQREMVDADIYPDLMGKSIGLLLVQEEYMAKGEKKSKLAVVGCYEPATSKTAAEIWRKEPAKALPTLIAGLRDKPLRGDDATRPPPTRTMAGNAPADEFPDSDIPF